MPLRFLALWIKRAVVGLCFRLRLCIIGQVFQVGIVGSGSIGAPGPCDARCLLHGHPMQAVGQLRFKDEIGVLIWACLLGTKQADILLAQRQIDRHHLIQGVQPALVGFDQANMRDRMGQPRFRLLFAFALLLLCVSFPWLLAHSGPIPLQRR